MNAQEEILDSFFKELKRLDQVPNPTIQKLEKLWREGKLASMGEILNAIDQGIKHVSKS
jgi:hypothetical protein